MPAMYICTSEAACCLLCFSGREVTLGHGMLAEHSPPAVFACLQEKDQVVMVQEYADGGDLFALLQKYGGRLSERVAVQMVLDPFLRVLQVNDWTRTHTQYSLPITEASDMEGIETAPEAAAAAEGIPYQMCWGTAGAGDLHGS